jgi:hypothetical protein
LTATFRGEQGLNKIKCFLDNCAAIQTGFVAERVLQLDVYGKLTEEQIKDKII